LPGWNSHLFEKKKKKRGGKEKKKKLKATLIAAEGGTKRKGEPVQNRERGKVNGHGGGPKPGECQEKTVLFKSRIKRKKKSTRKKLGGRKMEYMCR